MEAIKSFLMNELFSSHMHENMKTATGAIQPFKMPKQHV